MGVGCEFAAGAGGGGAHAAGRPAPCSLLQPAGPLPRSARGTQQTPFPLRPPSHQPAPHHNLTLTPVRCLAACSFPHTVALRGRGRKGEEKFVYQFGAVGDRATVDGLARMATEYCTSPDGYSSSRTRPTCLRGRVLARVPPPGGRCLVDASAG